MDTNTPYDDWSKHIHAVITFLKPYFDDWRSYVSLVSVVLGIGVLIMENQVLLRMRMGRWEIVGYALWCVISAFLGPIFDIVVMVGLFLYCRQKSNRLHITNESIAKALLPAPLARHYRVMGGVCITATTLTLTSNVLYMLRGWKEPSQFFSLSSDSVRWLTSQIWYAIGMIFLFHVVTRPAQSGVVLFGTFPRDLWAYKWYLCLLYIPVDYMLLELCNIHRDTKEILIPLEILVDVMLYNGPFLIFLLRVLYLAWKVAYDEAVLTGAIFEDEGDTSINPLGNRFTGSSRRAGAGGRSGGGEYVGLAMVDLDEAEHGESASHRVEGGNTVGSSPKKTKGAPVAEHGEEVYVLEDEGEDEVHNESQTLSPPSRSPAKSPVKSSSPIKESVVVNVDARKDDDHGTEEDNDGGNHEYLSPKQGGAGRSEEEQSLV
ncbi:hypothetical protein EDD21DRAFT_372062 [Dissophora ornata]|nr:hypothetical protein BGZ58_008689 [Dissophora ornata]KAI8602391.1 hypothetical protein EDD21DRAFT_372062 [Dissophora ornata]